MNPKKRGLGKGLDALLSNSNGARNRQVVEDIKTERAQHSVDSLQGELTRLPINQLTPGKYQPRKDMSAQALEELANSIKAQGIIQPIVVREVEDGRYEIIAGERRWRAAQQVRLETIPCIIKNVPDNAAVAIALIENIQREDLNAMEEAVALKRLMDEFELTHHQVGEAVGKSRATVSNLLRLNALEPNVKLLLENGDIDMGHGRALLSLEGELQTETARSVAAKGLTVRDTEKLVKRLLNPKVKPEPIEKTESVHLWQEALAQKFSTQVAITQSKSGKGKLVINFDSEEALGNMIYSFMESKGL